MAADVLNPERGLLEEEQGWLGWERGCQEERESGFTVECSASKSQRCKFNSLLLHILTVTLDKLLNFSEIQFLTGWSWLLTQHKVPDILSVQ